MTSEDLIRLSMEEAEKALKEGNSPFGVVVTDSEGNIVWKDHDRVKTLMDPTAHGEVNAIRRLCKKLGTLSLKGYKFYTSDEPCPPCLTSMIKAQVSEVYFGARTDISATLPIPAEELAARSKKYPIKVHGNILGEETLAHRNKLLNLK
jgi:guanine deaminase